MNDREYRYRKRFHPDAARELREVKQDYGSRFSAEIDGWLDHLVGKAERNDVRFTMDLGEFLESIDSLDPNRWKKSWKEWVRADLKSKVSDILTVIRKRQPPRETRTAERVFPDIASSFSTTVTAIYEVNHGEEWVRFLVLHGLRGN